MKRFLLILTLTTALFTFSYPGFEAKAIDPVSVAILSPIAIQLANAVLPRVLNGLASAGKYGVKAGIEVFQLLRIPYGLGLCCFLRWKSGLRNMGLGFIAPFKMAYFIVMMPVSLVTGVI